MTLGTAADVFNRASAGVARTSYLPDNKQQLAAEGVAPVCQAPRGFSTFLTAELKKWGKVLAGAGLLAE